jgi:uncharacterized protein YbjT (DUF2867 family)
MLNTLLCMHAQIPYTVVRPCGLNDKHPDGRPVVAAGDIAAGRINRADVAHVLATLLDEPAAVGKASHTYING